MCAMRAILYYLGILLMVILRFFLIDDKSYDIFRNVPLFYLI